MRTVTPVALGTKLELIEPTHPSRFPLRFAIEPDQILFYISTPYSSLMADYPKFSGSHSRLPTLRPSIHQSGDNAKFNEVVYYSWA